jgi:hypothetical protein
MSSLDTESGLPSLRDHVEAAVASHSPGPDIDNIVNGAVEHDRATRHRDRAKPVDYHQHEGEQADRRRSAIRSAIHENKLKIAAGPTQPARKHEAPAGAPASWGPTARADWDAVPEHVRLEIQREQAQAMNAIETNLKPHLERYAEIDRELSPIRHLYQQHGLSDAQGMAKIARTISALHDPRTAMQAYHELGRELNIAPLGYQPQQPDYSPQEAQAVEQHLGHFAQSHPHYEQARVGMGLLLQARPEEYTSRDGNFDLEKVYHDVCRILRVGVSDKRARRAANISPRSRSPAMSSDAAGRGGTIRNAIIDAFRESRAG